MRSNIIYPKRSLNEIELCVKKKIEKINKEKCCKKTLKAWKLNDNINFFTCLYLFISVIIYFYCGTHIYKNPPSFIAETDIFKFNPEATSFIITLLVFFVLVGIWFLIKFCNLKKNAHYIEEFEELVAKNGFALDNLNRARFSLDSDVYYYENIPEYFNFQMIEELKKVQEAAGNKNFEILLKLDRDEVDCLRFKDDEIIPETDKNSYYHITIIPCINDVEINKFRLKCDEETFNKIINDTETLDLSFLNKIIDRLEEDA